MNAAFFPFATVFAAFATLPIMSAHADLTLVENGQARGAIIVAPDASPIAREAAQDLQFYIRKSTGAELSILAPDAEATLPAAFARVYVGPSQAAERAGIRAQALEDEQYRVVTRGNALFLLGSDRDYGTHSVSVVNRSPGTIWSVNSVLDRFLGVRWLWPGEVGTFVPKHQNLRVPDLDFIGRPGSLQRELPMRWPKREANDGGVAGDGYRYLLSASEQEKLVAESLDWGERHQLGQRRAFNTTHGFGDWWRKYGATHPDYFAQTPPGIVQPYPEPERVKLRIGNPAVAAQIVQEWKDAGAPDIWRVAPNDSAAFDISAESRALDVPANQDIDAIWNGTANLTARYLGFWNGLLAEMKKTNPNVNLVTYVYGAYREPPPAGMKVSPGIVAGFVNTFDAYAEWDAWSAAGMSLILRPNWWHQGVDAPHIPLHNQGNYFRNAQNKGMVGFRFDQLYGFWGTQGASYYMIARLAERPDLSVDEVLDEYTSGFGSAAPAIKEYLNYWEDYTNAAAYPNLVGGAKTHEPPGLYDELQKLVGFTYHPLAGSWLVMPYLYPDAVITRGLKHLDDADVLARDDAPEIRARIQFLRDGLISLRATRDQVALGVKLRTEKTPENERLFAENLERLRALRRANTLHHVAHGDVQFQSEVRRGIPTNPIVREKQAKEFQGL